MAEKVPYGTLCSCNPANGGSGMCGCVMANQLVDPDLWGKTNFDTTTKPFTEWFTVTEPKTQTEIETEEFNEYLHMLADMKSVDLKRKKKLLADYLNNL
jgi:hypothetical protein